MKNIKHVFIMFFLLFCFASIAQSQSITIKMKRPPLNQLSVSDLYNIELVNTTNERVEFYLFGTLTESKAGLIATATTVSITLGPKERKQFKASDLPKTPDISYPNTDNRYKEALMRKGSLPDGNYTICIYAKQTGTNEELGNDCIDQEITIQSEMEITLLTPDNKIQIGADEPVVFSWTVLGGKSEGPYKIKIIEIKGDESPENAMLKNKAFFEKEGIRMSTFQYPSSAPKFEKGKSYIWQVSREKISSVASSFTMSRDDEGTNDQCLDSVLNVSTGYNHNISQVYDTLNQDIFWTLVAAPTNNGPVNIGGPAWVINRNGAWALPVTGSQWISAFSIPGANEKNMNTSLSAYVYRKSICVSALSDLIFNLSVLSDNKADVFFVDANGVVITNLGGTTSFTSAAVINQTVSNVSPGTYFLQIEHRNDNSGTPMGVNLQGTVTSTNGSAFNNIVCCNPPGSTITGYKFHDINNNGIKDNSDSLMQGWIIELTGNGISQTSVTDGNGNYLFTNLPPGTYTITEVMQSGWAAGQTGNQQTVTVDSNTSSNNINFGNIKSTNPCALCNSDFEESPEIANSNYIQVSESEIPCWETTASDNQIEIWSSGMQSITAFSGNQFAELNCTQVGTLYQTFTITSPITQTIYFAHRGRYSAPDVMNVSVGPVGGPYILLGTYSDNNTAWSYYSVSHTFANAGNYEIRFESVSSNGGNGPDAGGNFLDAISVGCPDTTHTVETNVCDSLSVTVQTGSGDCCWSINLINNQSQLGINGVQFLTQAPVTFSGYPSVPSNTQWQYQSSSPSDLSLVNITGGYLPQGQTNNFINFCLNNYTTSPQLVIVNWKHNDSIVCADTLKLNCQKECMELNIDSVYCYNDGYNINFSFLNQAGFDIHTLEVTPITPNTTIAPTNITLSPDVITGSNSGMQTIFAASTDDITELCFIVKAIGPENCCFCIDTICVPVQSCICSDVDVSASYVGPGCLWNVSLMNNYLPNYFTGVSLNILTSGVTYAGTVTSPTGWMLNNPSPFTTVTYKPLPWTNGGKVPSGTTSPLSFSLAGFTTSPTTIVVNWLTAGQNGDSIVCRDTLTLNCTPTPVNNGCLGIFNDSLWCNADGTFGYQFQVFNAINGFTAEGFALSPLPVGSAAFNPAVFPQLNLPPLTNSGILSSTISGVNSGEELCFRTTMYDSIYSINNQTWSTLCCHFDTCYTMPDCGTVINECDCKGGKWNSNRIGINIDNGSGLTYNCGEQITINVNSSIAFNFPSYMCNSNSCPAEYEWILSSNSPMVPSISGSGQNVSHTFTASGVYTLKLFAFCGGKKCDSCEIKINVTPASECNCKKGKWNSSESVIKYTAKGKSTNKKIKCGDTYEIDGNSTVSLSPNYNCGQANCNAKYTYRVNDGTMTGFQTSPYNISNITNPTTVMIYAWCGEKICDSCVVYLKPSTSTSCSCGKWNEDKPGITIHGFNGNPNEEIEEFVKCDDIYKSIVRASYMDLVSQTYFCIPDDCKAAYEWVITSPSGTTSSFGTQVINSFQFNQKGTYNIYLRVFCGGVQCGECKVQINVKAHPKDPK